MHSTCTVPILRPLVDLRIAMLPTDVPMLRTGRGVGGSGTETIDPTLHPCRRPVAVLFRGPEGAPGQARKTSPTAPGAQPAHSD